MCLQLSPRRQRRGHLKKCVDLSKCSQEFRIYSRNRLLVQFWSFGYFFVDLVKKKGAHFFYSLLSVPWVSFFFEGTLKAHKCNDCPWSLRKGTKARVGGPQFEGSICLCRMRSKALGMLKLTQDRGVKVREVFCRLSMDA